MSSFFTAPASQRKRKREDTAAGPPRKRATGTGSKPNTQNAKPARPKRDESISSSGSDDGARRQMPSDEEKDISSESDDEDETGAERRLRLAERYLENIKGEVDEVGFDAEEIDRDLIAERLQEDVAETKGRLYRYIASDLSFPSAIKTQFRADTLTKTSIAVCAPYAYTVSKDLTLIKWELPTPPPPSTPRRKTPKKPPPPTRRRPIKLVSTKGNKNKADEPSYNHHTAAILTVAASSSGKFVATGGADKRLIIWSAADLTPLRVFTQHRDAVTSLAFRRGTNQLYSASKDRTIKTWSLDDLAYVETLFGHQDEVVDVAALALERCVSVGARDRTARLWKVVEETQLVFRGGGGGGGGGDRSNDKRKTPSAKSKTTYAEGSIDRIALIDEETFITGSDNGALCLWNLQKKKPVFTVPLAHGVEPPLTPEEAFAEQDPDPNVPGPPLPRWITALATVPYSDLILSGSWDGSLRVWRITADKKRIESVGVVGASTPPPSPPPPSPPPPPHPENAITAAVATTTTTPSDSAPENHEPTIRGVINDIAVFERGDRGKDGLCVVAAVGTEHRFGRWKSVSGRNGAVVFEVGRKVEVGEREGSGGGRVIGN